MNEIASLIRVSERVGRNPLLSQGSSGNTSVKSGDLMWIKASGKRLARAGTEQTFVPVDIDRTRNALATADELTVCRQRPTSLKPSMETWMHAILPHAAVIHAHAVNTVAWSLRENGEDLVRARMSGLRWTWIPYAPSGRPLGRAVLAALETHPDVLILGNHGLVVGAPNIVKAESLLLEVERRLHIDARMSAPADIDALERRIDHPGWVPAAERVHNLAVDDWSFELATDHVLYPCQWVHISRRLAVMRDGEGITETLARHRVRTGLEPLVALSPRTGVMVHRSLNDGSGENEVMEQVVGLAEIVSRIPRGTEVRTLSHRQIAALDALAMPMTALAAIAGYRFAR